MEVKNIVIAGGGTGGHIYPGVAIARACQKIDKNIQIHFVGSKQGLETKIVPKEGFPLHLLDVGKLNYQGHYLQKLITLIKFPMVLIQAARLVLKLKPVAVLGVGGYASGPFVLVASWMGCRTAIWEPNAFPGMTNRWLSRFVKKSFVVFKDAEKYLQSTQIVQVGLPVREAIENMQKSEAQKKSPFRILVFGGSQGARAINQAVSQAVAQNGEWLNGIEILHQTGSYDFLNVQAEYAKINHPSVQVQEFIYDMEKKYEWADLIICRAGASTVAEVAASGKPAVFIPLPTAADDHQRKNAESLVQKNAAAMILQKDLTPDSLIEKIQFLRDELDVRKEYQKNLQPFYIPNAALKTAELLLKD